MRNNVVNIVLFVGILLLVNLLANQFFLRIDLTEDGQYTLSKATKNILKSLEDPVTVKAYFSGNLPPDVEKTKRDFQEMLIEYANISKGYVDYEFVSPETDEEKQEALNSGIRPVMINVREKDAMQQQQAFMGAVVSMGELQDVIPFIQPDAAMEYALSTSIKKISVVDKPAVGLIQGHGEPGLADLGQAYQALSILNSVENIDLNAEPTIADRFKTVAIVAPTDSFPPNHFAKLDAFLARGGRLFVAYNAVNGDLQTAQGTAINTGLETWLGSKGIEIQNAFVLDSQCGSVTVQQRQGFFTINTPVQFPYLPVINAFTDHPITKGLEQVLLPFASPVNFLGDTSLTFTPFLQSSGKAAIQNVPVYFDVQKDWASSDFPLSNITIGGIVEGDFGGGIPGKIVIIGDGDFAVSGQQGRGQSQDNINLMVNSLDWLSDDTGLIELRTKGVASRPISEEFLGDEAEGKRNFWKYLNFGLPIVLILLYGFFRTQRQRNLKLKRMQEKYA